MESDKEINADKSSEAVDEPSRRRISDLAGAASGAFGRSFDRLTGAEFRRQFEEFTNAVSTTVVGVHRDQEELGRRLEEYQSENSSRVSHFEFQRTRQYRIYQLLALVAILLSFAAVIIGVIALVRTF